MNYNNIFATRKNCSIHYMNTLYMVFFCLEVKILNLNVFFVCLFFVYLLVGQLYTDHWTGQAEI